MTNTTMPAPATTLRERMIEDMKLQRLCRTMQRNYLRDVERFAIWLGRPPDAATDEDLRRYQIEQSEMGYGAPAMNTAVSALRFFYRKTVLLKISLIAGEMFCRMRPATIGAEAESDCG